MSPPTIAPLLAAFLGAAAAEPMPPPLPPAPVSSTSPPRAVTPLPEGERLAQGVPSQGPIIEAAGPWWPPAARDTSPQTRIEQRRQGNRVVEIVVTPAGSTLTYVMVNREGRPPLSNQELSSGLSLPRLLRFDF
ncbi:MAG: hypothetical protein RMK97_03045 [Sutterellaceae bacterium]|nr:hypothetical protein [Burkholderiaceae bacterium]MCX7901702.1 hypothetical protein [Burkholderiaceae bacterium]MDW8429472.1 hypothetical protein [Sutterellaceae bacterium]